MRPVKFITAIAALFLLAGPAVAQDFDTYEGSRTQPIDNAAYADFLSAYVTSPAPGVTVVDYDGVSDGDHDALKGYIRTLEAIDPRVLGRDAAFAYWVNLYNAVTLDVVLDNYPVESIRDIRFGLGLRPGPWREDLVTVAGRDLSLDNIEHDILREYWDEPRVHFAVNCASIGCPALRQTPFTASALDEQLDAAASAFLNTERALRVEDDEVIASSIFKWFQGDFGGSEAATLDYIRPFLDEENKASLSDRSGIDSYEYDWSLNEAE